MQAIARDRRAGGAASAAPAQPPGAGNSGVGRPERITTWQERQRGS